ncbi:hypothetical protein P5V15_014052 [Pogonomyrmex californicus]
MFVDFKQDVTDGLKICGQILCDLQQAKKVKSSKFSERAKIIGKKIAEYVAEIIQHPKWTLKSIHRHGGTCLKRMSDLNLWKAEIEKGGDIMEKFDIINKEKKQFVTTRILQQWASAAAVQYRSQHFNFTASQSWVNRFKKEHSIRQCKVTRYIKFERAIDVLTILKQAEKFQKKIAKIITKFDHQNLVCERRKINRIFLGDFNKVTHSYTAQYAITAAGELLPKVFLCMQEVQGNFGPRIHTAVQTLMRVYGNVFVTASKSGKLTKNLFNTFVHEIIKPYCKDNNFFKTFYLKHSKFLQKEILQERKELLTRENAIKIHSIIHHQLSNFRTNDKICLVFIKIDS